MAIGEIGVNRCWEWSRVEWNRMEQNGTEWNRMEQNGTEWNRMEQSRIDNRNKDKGKRCDIIAQCHAPYAFPTIPNYTPIFPIAILTTPLV